MTRNHKLILTGGVAFLALGAVAVTVGTSQATSKATGKATTRAASQVCTGSTVTFSNDPAGEPAATSDRFAVGTRLKVTNLDNGRAVTVRVAGPSGSCALLNESAFEQVREPGKNLIRKARIERVGGGQEGGMGGAGGPAPSAPAGEQVCTGSTVTFSNDPAGEPAATSDRFAVGTRLKVTNLDNGRAVTVRVAGPSGSCALLNESAFEQVREPGKNLIRKARIERVG
ncbi:hypothetical protein [Streptomyces massasporeus]|uniref:hypothetical protein n=1 Tax=Streptomyces massasporeus TaxID=67324 RepID=UPI0033E4C8B6